MVKIHQHFIKTFITLFSATFISTSVVSYFLMQSYLIDSNKKELQERLNIVEYQLNSVNNLDSYVKGIASAGAIRLTIIDKSGLVVAESNFDKATMKNHLDREEIRGLQRQKVCFSTRYSNTLQRKFIYGAKEVTYRDKKLYLRLAKELSTVFNDFLHIWGLVVVVFLLFLLVAFYYAYKMSLKVESDLEELRLYLKEVTERNYEAVIRIRNYYEFLEISLLLKNMIKKLYTRDKKKNKI